MLPMEFPALRDLMARIERFEVRNKANKFDRAMMLSISAAKDVRSHLERLFREKGCDTHGRKSQRS